MKAREPMINEHTKKILKWRDSFLHLEENRFFEIMKMYLGEIKTPYNKQRLIESLESFIRNKDNLVTIRSYLSEQELEIICAVIYIPDATEEKISTFLGNTYSFSFIYETVANLEERLILYRTKKDASDHSSALVLNFNPLLEAPLSDLISIERLLQETEYTSYSKAVSTITPEFIVCFIAYIVEFPSIAKQDGSLKKHTVETAGEIFGDNVQKIAVLYKGFLNLGILKESGRGVEVDWGKLKQFVKLEYAQQIIYLLVSSYGHFSRETLRIQAEHFVDVLKNLGNNPFTENQFLRTGYLVYVCPMEIDEVKPAGLSRFSKILQEARARQAGTVQDGEKAASSGELECMFDAAVKLGLFYESGRSSDETPVFSVADIWKSCYDAGNFKGMFNIDSGMDVSLMPGFRIEDSIELAKFMSLKHYDVVSTFTFDRSSVMRGFDFGLTSEKIKNFLSERTAYNLPESVGIQIDEWDASYSAASFYKGFILKVDGKTAVAAEKNPVIAPHIHTVIAPGVYLLDIQEDSEALTMIKESGLDFIGRVKTAGSINQSVEYPSINLNGRKIAALSGLEVSEDVLPVKNIRDIEKSLYAELDKLDIDDVQRESLELRIEHKVIINSAQLNSNTLRLEKVVASAMDFAGKVYVIEQAIKNSENIEITYAQQEKTVFGRPLGIKKVIDECFVEVLMLPSQVSRQFSLAKAQQVKRIRKNIYRD